MKKKGYLSHYNTYFEKIYRYIFFRVGRNKELAEDMTSEIFLKAYEKFEDFDHDRSFGVWIYRIAHNHLVDQYKKKKLETVPVENVEYKLKSMPQMEKNLDVKMHIEKVGEVLEDLPENQRNIMLLKFFEDLTNREISQILDITEEHIRVLQHRALQTVRVRIDYLKP